VRLRRARIRPDDGLCGRALTLPLDARGAAVAAPGPPFEGLLHSGRAAPGATPRQASIRGTQDGSRASADPVLFRAIR
jgi:hypothetical protein